MYRLDGWYNGNYSAPMRQEKVFNSLSVYQDDWCSGCMGLLQGLGRQFEPDIIHLDR